MQLRHWRRGTTEYRELKAMGASDEDARMVAANSRCWWRNSHMRLNRALPIAYFDRLGVPRLSLHQRLEPPGADPHVGWCGRGRPGNLAAHISIF